MTSHFLCVFHSDSLYTIYVLSKDLNPLNMKKKKSRRDSRKRADAHLHNCEFYRGIFLNKDAKILAEVKQKARALWEEARGDATQVEEQTNLLMELKMHQWSCFVFLSLWGQREAELRGWFIFIHMLFLFACRLPRTHKPKNYHFKEGIVKREWQWIICKHFTDYVPVASLLSLSVSPLARCTCLDSVHWICRVISRRHTSRASNTPVPIRLNLSPGSISSSLLTRKPSRNALLPVGFAVWFGRPNAFAFAVWIAGWRPVHQHAVRSGRAIWQWTMSPLVYICTPRYWSIEWFCGPFYALWIPSIGSFALRFSSVYHIDGIVLARRHELIRRQCNISLTLTEDRWKMAASCRRWYILLRSQTPQNAFGLRSTSLPPSVMFDCAAFLCVDFLSGWQQLSSKLLRHMLGSSKPEIKTLYLTVKKRRGNTGAEILQLNYWEPFFREFILSRMVNPQCKETEL